MSRDISSEILEIQMLQSNLLKELHAYNKDLKKETYSMYPYPFSLPNKHKASFNRLRLELNNKYIELSKEFKKGD